MIIGDASFPDVVAALYPAQERLGREINPKVYTRLEWQKLVAQQGAFVRDVLTKLRLIRLGQRATTADPALRKSYLQTCLERLALEGRPPARALEPASRNRCAKALYWRTHSK
jgi:hypothetical protein